MKKTNKDITTEFVNRFQHFEKLVKELSKSSDRTHFTDAVRNLETKYPYLREQYQLIEDLYALRNVFSHRQRSKYITNVTALALSKLDSIINRLENPILLKDSKTIIKDVYEGTTESVIKEIMQDMIKNNYTHVPIWDKSVNKYIGVFSHTSLFMWLSDEVNKQAGDPIFINTLIKDINRKYMNKPNVNYKFMAETVPQDLVLQEFTNALKRKQRLDCVFINKDTSLTSKITGIVTPWDLPAIRKELL